MSRAERFSTFTLVALSLLMTAAFVAGVKGQQHDPTKPCLNGCGKKQTPAADGCCQEPDCGILQEYAVQEALEWALSGPSVPTSWIPASATGIVDASGDAYVQALYDQARRDMEQSARNSASCPGYSPPRRHLQLDKDCQIGTYAGSTFNPMSREDARTDLNMGDCPEIRDAEYDAAEERQTLCEVEKVHRQNAANPARHVHSFSRDDIIAEAGSQARARLTSLRNSMLQFWLSCKNLGNQQALQQITDALAPPLQQKMPSKPPPKKAKRASGGGRGGRRGGSSL